MANRKKSEETARKERIQILGTKKLADAIKKRADDEDTTVSDLGFTLLNSAIKGAKRAVAKPSERRVILRGVANIPCTISAGLEDIFVEEEEEVVISDENLLSIMTPHAFVARASGMSMANTKLPRGINDHDQLLMIPFNEYNRDLVTGDLVYAKIRFKNGNFACTLKELVKGGLRAQNAEFDGVYFGPTIKSATVLAVCRARLSCVW